MGDPQTPEIRRHAELLWQPPRWSPAHGGFPYFQRGVFPRHASSQPDGSCQDDAVNCFSREPPAFYDVTKQLDAAKPRFSLLGGGERGFSLYKSVYGHCRGINRSKFDDVIISAL